MKSDRFKGYLFAIIGTLAFSNEYIFSKAAMNEVHMAQFGVYWFAVSTVLILLYTLRNNSLKQVRVLTKRQTRILITLGFLEILTTTSFYLSIHIIPDPAVTSFLGSMYPVMLVLGGVLVLGEKFGPVEIVGGFLALAGAFIIGYTGETDLKKLFIPGTGVVLLNAFFATVASLVVKVHVKKLSPELLNLNRCLVADVFFYYVFCVQTVVRHSFVGIEEYCYRGHVGAFSGHTHHLLFISLPGSIQIVGGTKHERNFCTYWRLSVFWYFAAAASACGRIFNRGRRAGNDFGQSRTNQKTK